MEQTQDSLRQPPKFYLYEVAMNGDAPTFAEIPWEEAMTYRLVRAIVVNRERRGLWYDYISILKYPSHRYFEEQEYDNIQVTIGWKYVDIPQQEIVDPYTYLDLCDPEDGAFPD